jgi:hypothetical protein
MTRKRQQVRAGPVQATVDLVQATVDPLGKVWVSPGKENLERFRGVATSFRR